MPENTQLLSILTSLGKETGTQFSKFGGGGWGLWSELVVVKVNPKHMFGNSFGCNCSAYNWRLPACGWEFFAYS